MRALALLIVLWARTAGADPAEAAYQEGKRFYDLKEWDAAIAKFKEAYRLRSDAPSLFNIAQAYRLQGNCAEALSYYKAYRRNFPNDKALDRIDKFIVDMEDCVKRAPAPADAPPAEPQPVRTRESGEKLRIAGIVVGAIGVAAFGTGVVFGLQAVAKQNELEAGGVWNQQLYDDGNRADRNATILMPLGGAAIVGGVVLYWVGRRAGSEARVGLIPARGGASLVWSCAY